MGHSVSLETRRKISETNIRLDKKPPSFNGHHHTPLSKIKISEGNKGKKDTKETRLRRIASARRGKESNFWKGGATPMHLAIRMSTDYRIWRKAVFERDNYTCIWCGKKGGRLNADHIKRFSDFPKLRLVVDNGRTLCENCHKTTNTFGRWRK